MFGMSPLIAALVVSLAAFLVSAWWFGVNRRRRAETTAGVTALASMKWRECVGLVLQALAEKGFVEAPSSRQPGDGGTEFLLSKDNERCLLSYKHGTAYRLGEANVRDFANAVQLQGATSGILVTLGTAEGFARDIARRYGVDLIDGRSLWPQVEPFAPATLIEDIRHNAALTIKKGQRLGVFASLGLGLLVFLAGSLSQPTPLPASVPASSPVTPPASAPVETPAPAVATAPAPAPAPAASADLAPASAITTEPLDQGSRDANDATDAMAELAAVAKLTEAERAQRRLMAATRVADLDQVNSAGWAAQSTLLISLVKEDGIDAGVVNDACAILVEYEEMRYSRLQLEPPQGSTAPVRWRQCQ